MNAMCGQTEAVVYDLPPKIEQIKFLKRHVDSLPLAERVDLTNVIKLADLRSSIKTCSEGSAVDLDLLPEQVVADLYAMLCYKLDDVK